MSASVLYKANILKLLGNKRFNQVCRICISGKGHLQDIHSTRIPKMIESCACIEVSDEDGLPSKICVTCFHLITKFYSFKKKMECTDKILRQLLNDKLIQKDTSNDNIMHLGEFSEEDIPLSQRLKIQVAMKKNKNTNQQKEDSHKFTTVPPPLVPLASSKKLEVAQQSVLVLHNDTPPLVPIKQSIMPSSDDIPNIGNMEYHCSTCEKKFTNVKVFKEHKLTTCQSNALQCSICKKEFKEKKKLISHLKGHTTTKDYACKICGLLYPNPSTVQIHIRSHTGERPFRCKVCNKGFARAAGVLGHMKIHEDVKPHKCEDCGRSFKIASNLRRHKKLHTGEVPFQCSTCNKSFSQGGNLQLHIRTYHTNDRPYLCNECGKCFVNSTRLNRHMWIHSGYKPYVCPVCSKAYSNYYDLKNHKRCHGGKNPDEFKKFACDVCDKKFFQQCWLKRHKRMHDRIYTCQFCNRAFYSDSLLRKHLSSKHDIPYEVATENEEKYFMECEEFEVKDMEKSDLCNSDSDIKFH